MSDIHWIAHAGQRMGFMPSRGGAVTAWTWYRDDVPVDVWRAWDGAHPAIESMACYPMVPWTNRISGGGFTCAGRFHALSPNTANDPYPIHGDGWLQPWTLLQPEEGVVHMELHSDRFAGGPYTYWAQQAFELTPDGLSQSLTVRNESGEALPFGLGLHPWFTSTPRCTVRSAVDGVWMSRPDKIPTGYEAEFPKGWDLNAGIEVSSVVIDNGFGGWSGSGVIEWPERCLRLTMDSELLSPQAGHAMECLLYSPAEPAFFCFEPVTHPIDAPHLPGQPGWVTLAPGESMRLRTRWGLHSLA